MWEVRFIKTDEPSHEYILPDHNMVDIDFDNEKMEGDTSFVRSPRHCTIIADKTSFFFDYLFSLTSTYGPQNWQYFEAPDDYPEWRIEPVSRWKVQVYNDYGLVFTGIIPFTGVKFDPDDENVEINSYCPLWALNKILDKPKLQGSINFNDFLEYVQTHASVYFNPGGSPFSFIPNYSVNNIIPVTGALIWTSPESATLFNLYGPVDDATFVYKIAAGFYIQENQLRYVLYAARVYTQNINGQNVSYRKHLLIEYILIEDTLTFNEINRISDSGYWLGTYNYEDDPYGLYYLYQAVGQEFIENLIFAKTFNNRTYALPSSNIISYDIEHNIMSGNPFNVHLTGNLPVLSLEVPPGVNSSVSWQDVFKAFMLINNLGVYSDREGHIRIRNRQFSSGESVQTITDGIVSSKYGRIYKDIISLEFIKQFMTPDAIIQGITDFYNAYYSALDTELQLTIDPDVTPLLAEVGDTVNIISPDSELSGYFFVKEISFDEDFYTLKLWG
jgi:hypothetical protein